MLALIKGEPLPAEHADTVHFGCPLATRDERAATSATGCAEQA